MKRLFRKSIDNATRSASSQNRRRRQQPVLEALEGRQLLSLASQDFLVNSTTRNNQFFSDNASSANGRSVAVWGDPARTDQVDNDIRAQIYNAQGLRVGSEIIVEFSSANQANPRVAMDAVGNFVVTYEETNNGQTDIIAKRFNSSGTQLGGRIAIATSAKSEHDADVAMDANGNFVVSYTEDFSANDKDIKAVRFNSSGAFQGPVQLSQAAHTFDFDESRSSVAMSPDGRFDIVYQSGSHGGGSEGVHVTTFKADGTRQFDGPIFTQQFPTRNPSVSMDDAGNAVIAYQTVPFGGTGNATFAVQTIRMSSNGLLGTIRTFGAGNHSVFPTVALSHSGGSYVVGYDTDLLGGTGHTTVEIAEVNGSNTTLGFLNLGASPNNAAPALSIAGNGSYLLTFTAGIGSSDQDIHGRRGFLSSAPAAKDLTLTPSVHVGQSAVLKGRLTDADADPKLKLSVVWGDGSPVQKSQPGLKPFTVTHKYGHAGTYSVRVIWTDSTGLSNSKVLKVKVLA